MTETQRKHILSTVDFSMKEVMFKDTCKELKLVLSGGSAQLEAEGIETDKNEDVDQNGEEGSKEQNRGAKKLSLGEFNQG